MVTIAQYEMIKIRGIEAVQNDRGGYVFQGRFYYPAATNVGILDVEAKDWVSTVDINSGNGSLAFGS